MILGDPVYRQLFNHTIDYFPRSVLVLSSAIALWNAGWNIFLGTQKSKMRSVDDGIDASDALDVDDNNKVRMLEVLKDSGWWQNEGNRRKQRYQCNGERDNDVDIKSTF